MIYCLEEAEELEKKQQINKKRKNCEQFHKNKNNMNINIKFFIHISEFINFQKIFKNLL